MSLWRSACHRYEMSFHSHTTVSVSHLGPFPICHTRCATTAETQIGNEFSESEIFNLLDKVKPTAFCLGCLPYWFLKLAVPSIALALAHLFNLSLKQSVVPSQWKISCITPVPKTTQPQTCQQFRPISVTPISSRIMEKTLVRRFLYPVLCDQSLFQSFSDQFTFRPSG